MRNLIPAVVLVLAAACGGGSAPGTTGGGTTGGGSPATVNGAIGGQSMAAKDAISTVLTIQGVGTAGQILISNAPDTCAKVAANQQPKNAQAVLLVVGTQSATGVSAPSSPGSYPVYSRAASNSISGNVAIVEYASSDATCKTVAAYEAASGTVTITNVGPSGAYWGTFDVTFSGSGGHVTGSFSSASCSALRPDIGGTCT